MANQVLVRLDRMITKHELLLARARVRRGVVPDTLQAQINRLETGLYALREGVHGFMKAKECGFPLKGFDSYLDSFEDVATQSEELLLKAIAELEAFEEKERPV